MQVDMGRPCDSGDMSTTPCTPPPIPDSPEDDKPAPPRKRGRYSSIAAHLRRPSMQTRAKAKPPAVDTRFRVLKDLKPDADQPTEWVGELPSLHSKNKTVDQRQADAESDRQQDVTRPHGVERDEFLETHLQDALGSAGAHNSVAEIPLPRAEPALPDDHYRSMYPHTLNQNKLYAAYFMDERDNHWLEDRNRQFASGRAESSQPVASTSSSATMLDDAPMDVDDPDDGGNAIRVKTEPLPDRSSWLRSPVAPHTQRRATLPSDPHALTQPVPDRTTPNGSGPPLPRLIDHHIQDEGTCITEDELEFIMQHFECFAHATTRTVKPTIEKLREAMEPGFPARICTFIHNCRSERANAFRLPCICTHLTLVYPYWMQRREERQGRCLQPQLEVPASIAEDGADPYIVFRSTMVDWKLEPEEPRAERSRNPRRERNRAEKLELLARLPRVRLIVREPAQSWSPSPSRATSSASATPAPSSLPAHRPPRPRGRPSLKPVPPPPVLKDLSQTPVETASSPPANVNPAKAAFFSVEDARSVAIAPLLPGEEEEEDAPMPLVEALSPLTSEAPDADPDPDA